MGIVNLLESYFYSECLGSLYYNIQIIFFLNEFIFYLQTIYWKIHRHLFMDKIQIMEMFQFMLWLACAHQNSINKPVSYASIAFFFIFNCFNLNNFY